MLFRRPALFAALVCLAAGASAQSTQERIDRIFARWTRDTPGCVVGVAEQGKPVWVKAYGMADLAWQAPNGADTIFEAGSVSKQFTAFAIALLARDGKLSLDDPAQRHLPELPDYGAPLTIRHMLHHTSGLRDWGSIAFLQGAPRGSHVYSNADVLAIAARQRALNFAPGTDFSYSNTNYNLAALIVERVSGVSLAQFSRERIFVPLGMSNTSWRDDHRRIVRGRAMAYDRGAEGLHLAMPFENTVGAGGLLTTVRDLLKWNDNFAKPVVGDAAMLAQAIAPSLLPGGIAHHYAFGIMVGRHMGLPELSHTGATGGYRSALLRFPEQQLSLALLCNGGSASEAQRDAHQVADVLLEKFLKPGSAPLPSPPLHRWFAGLGPADTSIAALQELAGRYASAEVGQTLTVALEDGKLVLRSRTGQQFALAAAFRDAFRFPLGRVIFRRGADGKVAAVSIGDDRAWDVRFERVQ